MRTHKNNVSTNVPLRLLKNREQKRVSYRNFGFDKSSLTWLTEFYLITVLRELKIPRYYRLARYLNQVFFRRFTRNG